MMSRQAAPSRGSSGGAPLNRRSMRHRIMAIGGAGVLAAGIAVPVSAVAKAPVAQVSRPHVTQTSTTSTGNFDGVGIAPGKIKHVWLIILENKSYDATFTGLNNNTYLWQQLPKQGVLLKNYYGTGHFSLDNYISMVSGQAPITDDQDDCPLYNAITGYVDTAGTVATNSNYGQLVSTAGPNASPGANGCVYPATVPTLFNQLDAAHVSWKGYAQDLGNPDAASTGTLASPGTGQSHDAGISACGAPYASPGATGSTSQPNPGSANATDQYVPKHFPFPWFESILQSGDCNPTHIASLFDPANGLFHDLQSEATTPAFSWITPNNCSDGHDAVCHGNNLSGGFVSDGNPVDAATEPIAPINYTGGLYAADLFLQHVVPEIEASPAYKDGGLIDITFDEAFPPFTYTGNSFNNSTTDPANYQTSLASDIAGETLGGKSYNYEPTGPNTPLAFDANGNELYPGPGYNSYIDRPSACVAQATGYDLPSTTCLLGGGSHSPGARTDSVTVTSGSSTIADNSIVADDKGRSVTSTTAGAIPAGAFVGTVADTFQNATAANQSGGLVDTGSFTLVDSGGNPLPATGDASTITLGAETNANDPLFTATGVTNGGGDTGSVLISKYIKGGTTSRVFYNHYSWLRTMEDLFGVASTSPGLDGLGHIGYAAQVGLQPFGTDVFNDVPLVCVKGFTLKGGKCIKVVPAKCGKGFTLNKHSKCVKVTKPKCPKGFTLNKHSKCVKVTKPKH